MTKKPIIGITLDSEKPGGYSLFPWVALRENYADSIVAVGGTPVLLPHVPESVNQYLDTIQGLIITGGNFDIDPALYGASSRHDTIITKDRRTQFEWAITKAALERDMPILGICGGHQLINVILGGTLLQHIPDDIPNALEHQQRIAGVAQGKPHHDIKITKGTLLHQITGSTGYKTNSSHHQAIKTLGQGLVVNAQTSDGVIEGIEYLGKEFVLGLEWHPEYLASKEDKKILAAFVEAAS
jgi:putative glutamine amidotransferase